MPKKTNEPSIGKLSEQDEVSYIPSGIQEFDDMLGGLPRGRVTEVWGKEGVGKTYMVSKMLAHNSDKKVLLIDSEFAVDKKRIEQLGGDLGNINFIADARLERVAELMIDSIGKYDLIVLDSLASLTPLTVEKQEVGENAIGLFARLVKHWAVKFRPQLGESKTAFVATNQYRSPIGMYATAEPPGGKAWHHVVDLRLLVSKNNSSSLIKQNGKLVGHDVKVEIKKSRLGKPDDFSFPLMYKEPNNE